MKFTVLLIAVLSGLCAEAMAARIGVIERDLAYYSPLPQESLFEDDDDPDPWDLNFDVAIGYEESAIGTNGSSPGLPEPPPFTTIAVGMSCLGIFILYRRIRRKRRSARRRRVVRMRAIITAER
jgi:hypothetical protein